MKRIILLALVVMASASFSQVFADGKKDKKKKKDKNVVEIVAEPVVQPIELTSTTDSVSYAMGMNMTNGLIPFLIQNFGVDTAYMYKFIEGFEAAIDKRNNNKEMTAYGAGINIAHMVESQMIQGAERNMKDVVDSINTSVFNEGFLASLKKDFTRFNDSTAQAYVTTLKDREIQKNIKRGEDFLAENAKKEGVVTLPSGLQYKILRAGTGAVATEKDEVEVQYEGRLIDGTVFDSSYKRGDQPAKFRPTQVIKGWTEALTLMPEGSMWELYIPQNLAYGERQAGQIPPYSALIFKVELEKVNKASEAAPSAKPAPTSVTRPKSTKALSKAKK